MKLLLIFTLLISMAAEAQDKPEDYFLYQKSIDTFPTMLYVQTKDGKPVKEIGYKVIVGGYGIYGGAWQSFFIKYQLLCL